METTNALVLVYELGRLAACLVLSRLQLAATGRCGEHGLWFEICYLQEADDGTIQHQGGPSSCAPLPSTACDPQRRNGYAECACSCPLGDASRASTVEWKLVMNQTSPLG